MNSAVFVVGGSYALTVIYGVIGPSLARTNQLRWDRVGAAYGGVPVVLARRRRGRNRGVSRVYLLLNETGVTAASSTSTAAEPVVHG